MGEGRTFFRFCPACGKRFHITLVSKELVGERTDRVISRQGSWHGFLTRVNSTSMPVLVEQDIPLVVTVEDFQYTYRCKHCGHIWIEMQKKQEESKGKFTTSSLSTH